jgi:hypothetical protein
VWRVALSAIWQSKGSAGDGRDGEKSLGEGNHFGFGSGGAVKRVMEDWLLLFCCLDEVLADDGKKREMGGRGALFYILSSSLS